MISAVNRAVAQLAALLLLASFVLIGASLLDIEPGPVLFGPLLGFAVALYLLRTDIPHVKRYPHWALSDLGEELWLAPLVAASVVVVAPNATTGELQSLGGLLGLAALLLYFLRPLFRLLARLWLRVSDQPA